MATAGAATGADRAHSVEVLEHLEDQFLRSRQVGPAGLLSLWPLVKLASAIVAMHARRTGVIEMERR